MTKAGATEQTCMVDIVVTALPIGAIGAVGAPIPPSSTDQEESPSTTSTPPSMMVKEDRRVLKFVMLFVLMIFGGLVGMCVNMDFHPPGAGRS
jgi:hypothetical protein